MLLDPLCFEWPSFYHHPYIYSACLLLHGSFAILGIYSSVLLQFCGKLERKERETRRSRDHPKVFLILATELIRSGCNAFMVVSSGSLGTSVTLLFFRLLQLPNSFCDFDVLKRPKDSVLCTTESHNNSTSSNFSENTWVIQMECNFSHSWAQKNS